MGLNYFRLRLSGTSFFLLGLFCSVVYGQDEDRKPSPLAEAFNSGAPEVEPVVVGRDKWNEKKEQDPPPLETSQPQEQTSPRISELEPLETKQIQANPNELPLDPPKFRPATKIVRNFEGSLVFKPRKFGIAYDFPYQLENSRGKRLAFVDVGQLKGINPQDMVDHSVNIMGKLEPVEEGSDERVIRARIIRLSN